MAELEANAMHDPLTEESLGITPMNRRAALLGLGALTAGIALGLGGCGNAFLAGPSGTHPRRLPPVRVARDRVIRTVAGLRPFRPSGFVVRAEPFGDRLLVHNYGHGGSGLTLSWGTAHLAADLVSQAGRTGPVAVLGCGAVGLASARLLQRRGRDVTIYAKSLPPDTTSNVAGGSWYPSGVVAEARRSPAFDAQFEGAARLSHRYFQELAGEDYGVQWREQYFLSDVPAEPVWSHVLLRDLFPAPRRLERSEHPFAARYVSVENTLFVEPRVYLDAMLRDFRLAGGRVQVREFAGLDQVRALAEPVIVNCTGLGTRELFGDVELLGVKGQLVILLPQAEIDYAVASLAGHYMYPRRDGIVLGGTYEYGVESLETTEDAVREILAAHRAIFDSTG